MAQPASLASGRELFASRRWREAFEHLSAADAEAPLDADDLERLAQSAYLAGDSAWGEAWSREHQLLVERGELAAAARCIFWLAFGYLNLGEMAQGGGWLARGAHIVEELGGDCVARGFLLMPPAIPLCDDDPARALDAFTRAEEVGQQFRDADLIALAQQLQGHALLGLGETARAMARFDEVLLAVKSGTLSPIITGDAYCGAIEACQRTFDVRRMREWTAALALWCDAQPELVLYRGQCLAYLSSVAQTQGDWSAALDEAQRACRRLAEPVAQPAVGAAYYQRAELHRLRGEFADAEESYRLAGEHGRDPQPGLALQRLAQGQIEAAAASARRVLQETTHALARSAVLPACIDILLAARDLVAARAASDEFAAIGDSIGSRYLQATAARATGAVLLAEGDAARALAPLRRAIADLHALDAPYDTALARVLIGMACNELGDREGAMLEWQTARHVFEQLGAAPDIARLAAITGDGTDDSSRLTARELDILLLVATGKTNRAIADELVISEKTVARHLSNIFTKIDVPSRSAATAYAYDHGLVHRPA